MQLLLLLPLGKLLVLTLLIDPLLYLAPGAMETHTYDFVSVHTLNQLEG